MNEQSSCCNEQSSCCGDKQHKIIERQKASANMLLNADYPENIKAEMQTAFDAGKYVDVQRIAAEHDIKAREELDSKITMYPNPNFKEEPDLDEINDEIEKKLFEALNNIATKHSLEQGESAELSQKEIDSIPLHEIEDTNPRFLFKVEGIDKEFDSAYKAIRAYKEKNGIRQPKPGKHSFRRTIVHYENVCSGDNGQE